MNAKEQAIEWFTRLRESDFSVAQRKQFVAWLLESPAHLRGYLRTAEVWSTLQSADVWTDEATEDLLETVRQSKDAALSRLEPRDIAQPRIKRSRGWLPLALGTAALMLVALVTWQLTDRNGATYRTVRGEQRSFTLPDGSIVQLNTLSTLKVSFDEDYRRLELARGEAYFRVAPNKHRPFEVRTPFAVVRALGTEFNVYNHPASTRIAVIEGKVRVFSAARPETPTTSRSPAAAVDLVQRQFADVNERGQIDPIRPPGMPNIQAATAWTQRRIVLDGERVDAAAAEFNRYNTKRIQVRNPAVAAQRITGVFNADDPEALARYLQDALGVQIENTADQLTIK